MKFENLSSSQFADEINIQRSSLSHVLSGRNKPSLDFVMKIKHCFNDVSLDWILLGEGEMLVDGVNKVLASPNENQIHDKSFLEAVSIKSVDNDDDNSAETDNVTGSNNLASGDNYKHSVSGVHKILVFFSDGTYKEFKQI
ncbi:MAG: helix-turn-helix transcriptional regulator [Lentimicrobiaceae bacterium]|nr:helix-turn-helix transcriptional regulator [Lentimicrobiaceae bacterium]MBT7621222.1 helix-turn-helix transcriptional regulator [Lentimicrobiaceae bacterium]MCP4911447.1 helix-turn-helix transcriptional regulator [Bacteroidota bacterium]